jgi:hypothetical protein
VTDLEPRLRRELQKIAERPDPGSIRPLRVPPARGRKRLARWLAPVAAVAAVIAVVAGAQLVGRSQGHRPKPLAQFSAPPPEPAAPDVMPPYYVVVQAGAVPPLGPTAVVRSSRTGAVLANVRLPRLEPAGIQAISAAADNRTFLIADGNGLFLLRLAADGRSARFTRLSLTMAAALLRPAGQFAIPPSAALSPDGRMIAFEGQSSCQRIRSTPGLIRLGCLNNTIRLVSLVTGASRTWSTRASWQPGIWISWDGNDQVLFSWAAARKSGPEPSGYRLLNVASASSNLLAARMLPLPPLPALTGVTYEQSAFVTPGGNAVIASTFSMAGPGDDGTMILRIVELSARTGRVVAVLRQARFDQGGSPTVFANEGCSVLGLGAGGVHALVECAAGAQTTFGRVDDGRFTPLPGMTGLGSAATVTAAW